MKKKYSGSFVYDVLVLSLAIVRTIFNGLNDLISLDYNRVYIVLLDYSLSTVKDQ